MTSSPDPAAGSGGARSAGSAPFPAPLRRPDPEVALEYATRIFVSGERLDMQTLAAALRLGPGESARITVRVARGDGTQEDGAVLLRGGAGTRTRLPLLVTR